MIHRIEVSYPFPIDDEGTHTHRKDDASGHNSVPFSGKEEHFEPRSGYPQDGHGK